MPRGGFNNGPSRHAQSCRIVWQAVSRAPGMPIRQLAARTGLATTTISRALHTLRDVYGYIWFDHNAERARTILVPFIKLRNQ